MPAASPAAVPATRLVAATGGPARRLAILPPGERERRRARPDRRRVNRRTADLGSPYGVERRSGQDDRQADRRGTARAAGIGLMRDYFAQADQRTAPEADNVPAHLLVRFHD